MCVKTEDVLSGSSVDLVFPHHGPLATAKALGE